ncbi:MAG TPA: ice-binding family protein, partial [Iamia sp.]
MLIVGTVIIAVLIVGGLTQRRYRARATALAFVAALVALLAPAGTASAAVVATVPLGTASSFAVLGASEVTNTGASTLDGDLGLAPGPDITGFPPGLVLAPWTTYETTDEAASAQAALGTAYTNAATRSVDNDIVAELSGLTLIP